MTDPCTLEEVSKERFVGTILKAIPKNPCMAVKKEEPDKGGGGASDDGQIVLNKVKKKSWYFFMFISSGPSQLGFSSSSGENGENG